MFAVVGREINIVLVIALLTAAGSQLPRLVRALGQSPPVKQPSEESANADVGGSRRAGSPTPR